MSMQEDNGSWQPVIVVDDELKVSHGLIALICQGGMSRAHGLVRIIHLVDDVRNFAQVHIQP